MNSSETRKMARKSYSPQQIVAKLLEADALTSEGRTIAEATTSIGVTETTYRKWQVEYGGLVRMFGPSLLPSGRRKQRVKRFSGGGQ
jgi:transposase